MSYGKHIQEYQKHAIEGSSPLQLVIMLYDGAMRFMEAARHAIEQGDREKQNLNLQRAQRILMELMSCLDMDQGGEISKNLLSLYSYLLNELVMCNLHDDAEPLGRCIKLMSDLRESWATIERNPATPLAA